MQISSLRVPCLIGTLAWEQQTPQTLIIDLAYHFDPTPFAKSDNLNDTTDYSEIVTAIQNFAAKNRVQLLEAFTQRLATMLQQKFDLSWLSLQVKKPGAIPKTDYISASVELAHTES